MHKPLIKALAIEFTIWQTAGLYSAKKFVVRETFERHRGEGVRDLQLVEVQQRRLPALQAAGVGGGPGDQALRRPRQYHLQH